MANTPGDACELLVKTPTFARLNDTSIKVYAANAALTFMWQAHKWRQSLADFPPFYLTPNEPYHKDPDIDIPTDFWYLDKVWLDTLYGDKHDLDIYKTLTPAGYSARPEAVSWDLAISAFIFSPTPSEGYDAPDTVVRARYKKTPTAYTGTTLNQTDLPFDVQHFHLYVQALRVAYFDLLDDPRAGEVQYSGGRPLYTGSRAKFFGMLRETTIPEIQGSGNSYIVPESNLSMGASSRW